MMVTVTNHGRNDRVIRDTRGVYITIPGRGNAPPHVPPKTRVFSMPNGHIERFQNAPRPQCKLEVEINEQQPVEFDSTSGVRRAVAPKPTTLAVRELAGSDDGPLPQAASELLDLGAVEQSSEAAEASPTHPTRAGTGRRGRDR